jgi:TolB-like protein/DNA-binding winged helix-turn-helix (wHTH) protein/Flp pilus assembly protein TadD
MDSARHEHPPHAPSPVAAYHFCGFALDPAQGVLHRPDGVEIGLRPKATEVLCHLAREAGRVASRDDLMEAVWPGVTVTDDSITQCVAEIRRALGEEGTPLLRTLPKRGYMLAAEVTPGDVPPLPHAAPAGDAGHDAPSSLAVSRPAVAPPPGRPRHIAILAAVGLLAAALLGFVGWWAPSRPPNPVSLAGMAGSPGASPVAPPMAPEPARPLSLLVLPFATVGNDPGQDHIADGITDDLTTTLALIPGSFVIGRGTASAYKGQTIDLRQIGRDLGVRYVVQGSVRRIESRLRVNAQLLDAATGAHLWAEGHDELFVDIADLTHTLASRIAAALNYTLVWIEGDRAWAGHAHDPTALDLLLRGRALNQFAQSMEPLLEARRLLERSLVLDEGSADAHAFLAMVLVNLWTQNWEDDREGLLRRAEEHAARAVELNPRHARGHYARGQVAQSRRRFDQALAAFEVALGITPNLPFIHARRGWVRNLMGQPAEALADFAHAVRISPHEPYVGTTYWGMAFAHLMLGRDEDAVALAVRAIVGNPGIPNVRLQLASTLALVGRMEEARIALAEYRRSNPEMTVERFRRRSREVSGDPLWLATRDREAEALRGIGMPDE